jgi:hypothetical protein
MPICPNLIWVLDPPSIGALATLAQFALRPVHTETCTYRAHHTQSTHTHTHMHTLSTHTTRQKSAKYTLLFCQPFHRSFAPRAECPASCSSAQFWSCTYLTSSEHRTTTEEVRMPVSLPPHCRMTLCMLCCTAWPHVGHANVCDRHTVCCGCKRV